MCSPNDGLCKDISVYPNLSRDENVARLALKRSDCAKIP